MRVLVRCTQKLRKLTQQTCQAALFRGNFHTSGLDGSQPTAEGLPSGGGYLRTGHRPDHEEDPRFLVTGASGQIGAELIPLLRERHPESVVASDVKLNRELLEYGNFVYCDVQDKDNMARIILENGVTHVIHLATLLSAVGERNPQLALRVNTHGVQNVLELAGQHRLKVFAPSTIAVFGPSSPKINTPDETVKVPTTMYGITKVHQELLGSYYKRKFGVDYRSLRYPGIISSNTPPGGGTTDYAVEIFHAALTDGHYKCFLAPDTRLPFLYMPDCLAATYQLLTADAARLTQQTYNVTAVSFTPAELMVAIQRWLPRFRMTFSPDFRQEIASSWPTTIDDSPARRDWGWQHQYNLDAMVEHMLKTLELRLKEKQERLQQRRIKLESAVLTPGVIL